MSESGGKKKAGAGKAPKKKETTPRRKERELEAESVPEPTRKTAGRQRAVSAVSSAVQNVPAPEVLLAGNDSSRGDDQSYSGMAPFDETLLDVCRTRWQFGEWERLAAVDPETLRHHPERGRISLLVASAHFQLGRTQLGHRFLQLALDWGASRRQAAQMLVSGTHHSLAEAHLRLEQREPAREHFRQALRAGGVPGDIELLAQAREARSNPSTV